MMKKEESDKNRRKYANCKIKIHGRDGSREKETSIDRNYGGLSCTGLLIKVSLCHVLYSWTACCQSGGTT